MNKYLNKLYYVISNLLMWKCRLGISFYKYLKFKLSYNHVKDNNFKRS